MEKTFLERQQNPCLQKATPKDLNIRKITSLPKSEKFCDSAWANYSPYKIVNLGEKQNVEKHTKNVSRATTELFYAKIHSNKRLILKKLQVFQNRTNLR